MTDCFEEEANANEVLVHAEGGLTNFELDGDNRFDVSIKSSMTNITTEDSVALDQMDGETSKDKVASFEGSQFQAPILCLVQVEVSTNLMFSHVVKLPRLPSNC